MRTPPRVSPQCEALARSRPIVPSVAPFPSIRLGGPFDRCQTFVPERVQEAAYLRQPVGTRPVKPSGPLPTLRDQAGLAEDAQVLGGVRTTQVEVGCDVARGSLGRPDQTQDLPPTRLRDGIQDLLHGAKRIHQVT